MSKTSEAKPETIRPKAATIPIQIVLRRDANGELYQQSLTEEERQQLRDRYKEIDEGPRGQAAKFYKAFYHAAMHHPGDPEPLIVVSRDNVDEMIWRILDKDLVEETDFVVSIVRADADSPENPLDGFPKGSGADKIVKSGQPKPSHVRNHYKFKVVAKDKKEFDPDWYAADLVAPFRIAVTLSETRATTWPLPRCGSIRERWDYPVIPPEYALQAGVGRASPENRTIKLRSSRTRPLFALGIGLTVPLQVADTCDSVRQGTPDPRQGNNPT
jgi:hypothetical protein